MKHYGGSKEVCDYCGQEFKFHDKVLVEILNQMIFCYSLAGGCASVYQGERDITFEEMIFHGNT